MVYLQNIFDKQKHLKTRSLKTRHGQNRKIRQFGICSVFSCLLIHNISFLMSILTFENTKLCVREAYLGCISIVTGDPY